MNIQGKPRRPLKLFLDYWALVHLLEDGSWASHKDRLMAYCKNGDCTLVLTIWHVFEILQYGDKVRAKKRYVHLEELRKEVPCLWIRLRTELQRDEIAEAFFQAEGVDYKRKEIFYDEPVALIPNSEKASWFGQARRDGLLWFFNKPELFKKFQQGQSNYPVTKLDIRHARENLVGHKEAISKSQTQYVNGLVPTLYPSGLVIAEETKRKFLLRCPIDQFPSVYVETLLSEETNKDTKSSPKKSDLVDMQHIVSALPYVEIAVLDGQFCNYASIIRNKWKSSWPLAEPFSSIEAAFNRVEQLVGGKGKEHND